MKIGILTFSSAYNFGAVLQCFALKHTLSNLGYDVDVINFRPFYLATPRPRLDFRQLIMHPRSYLRRFIPALKRYFGYEFFMRRNCSLTKLCANKKELTDILQSYERVVIGSDQVWCNKYNNDDAVWYGELGVCAPEFKCLGYAISAGDAEFNDDELQRLKNALDNFSSLSVRESKLSRILEPKVDRSVPVVVDPSLLVDRQVWTKWSRPIRKDKYILTYQGRESSFTFEVADKIAGDLGARVLPVDFYPNSYNNGHRPFIASPAEFVSLVKNAECVVTTSFHGTAFAIICGIPFYTIRLNDGADERAENLLKLLNLEDRMLNVGDPIVNNKIDFKDVYERLDVLREESLSWLKGALL